MRAQTQRSPSGTKAELPSEGNDGHPKHGITTQVSGLA